MRESRTCVALRSPLEDFERTTLGAIPGLLAKLHYLAELHDGQGNYAHWGMGRLHGEGAARRAIRTLHATVLSQVLRTPLWALEEDSRRSAASVQTTPHEFVASFLERGQRALPERMGTPSERHLTAILRVLLALMEGREGASRPGASPPPQPGQ